MPRKKKKAERSFLQKHIGDPIEKYLDSQKDAISRAIGDRDRAKVKFADLGEKRRKHRTQCDKYVRREFCAVVTRSTLTLRSSRMR
jgi:hypothetical protein